MKKSSTRAIISEALYKEHSRANTERIRDFIGTDSSKMKVLIDLLLGDDLVLHQRGAYALNLIGEDHPEMVNPHLKKLLTLLPNPPHEAFTRAILRIYGMHPIPKKWLGVFADLCFSYLENPNSAIATRAFSMTVLFNIGKIENDLLPELAMLINEHYEHGTAAFKSRGKKILKEINKILA